MAREAGEILMKGFIKSEVAEVKETFQRFLRAYRDNREEVETFQ